MMMQRYREDHRLVRSLVFSFVFAGLCLPGAAAQSEAPVQPGYEAIAAMPHNSEDGVQLEAGIAVRDLRSYLSLLQHQRKTFEQTKLGAEFYGPGAQKKAFGFDLEAELQKIVSLADPQGGPVPGGVAIFSWQQGFGAQILVRVADGFMDRMAASAKSPQAPAWGPKVDGKILTISLGEVSVAGEVGEDGWLRLAPTQAMLLPAGDSTLFDGTMGKFAHDSDFMLFLRGGGVASTVLKGMVSDPVAAEFIGTMRGAAVVWKWDGDKTFTTRALVDIPQLQQLGPIVRRPDLANHLARLWDTDATDFLSLSLPPALVQMAPPALGGLARENDLELPSGIVDAISKLDGRFGWVSFGTPGDWALGLTFTDSAAVNALVPALRAWLVELTKKMDAGDVSDTYVLEPFAGSPNEVLHLRPDVSVEGMRVAGLGNVLVFVGQKSRLSALLAVGQAQKSAATAGAIASGPLTRPVREMLENPSMLLGYTVMSDDAAWMQWLTWSVGGLSELWKKQMKDVPGLEFVERYLDRMPTLLRLGAFAYQLTYDAALSLDLHKSVVVLQMTTSEI